MDLDWQVCSRARLSRDPRFDGKFFIGVRSTKIYCRPVCPVPTVKEKNVRYFPSAAAAAESGFRPCLRCRPECSPGTPAWLGASSTVSRALRLIDESGLEDGGIEGLAERLGVTSRHLRRLFVRHLGASPSAVAKTRRLHFAKKLVDETSLPMTDVALASGFGCVRRFNAVFRKTYKRTPTQIRRFARQKLVQPDGEYHFTLHYRPPYDWPAMLAHLAERATHGVEAVDERTYRRTIALGDHTGTLEVSPDAASNAVGVHVRIADPRSLYLVVERIRIMFDLNADWSAIAQSLESDPLLAPLIRASPGLRVPGCWDAFELAVGAIVGSDTTPTDATAVAGRIARSFGQCIGESGDLTHVFPTPEALADADLEPLGLTEARAETVRALARAVRDDAIRFDRTVASEAFVARMCELPGVDARTAQYVAMRGLGEPDALRVGEDCMRRALGVASTRELEQRAEAWRPWRSYASVYLWEVAKSERSPRAMPAASEARERSASGNLRRTGPGAATRNDPTPAPAVKRSQIG